ncbi:hypothetical protein LY78DRAFT_687389 [Colletotrichum sublineola]|nr:hypothetical protein LY78DRAFT_687389 [Colletotrichum sublineola]
MESGALEGTIIRIASNAGVCDSPLLRLQELMMDLNDAAATVMTPERKSVANLCNRTGLTAAGFGI